MQTAKGAGKTHRQDWLYEERVYELCQQEKGQNMGLNDNIKKLIENWKRRMKLQLKPGLEKMEKIEINAGKCKRIK